MASCKGVSNLLTSNPLNLGICACNQFPGASGLLTDYKFSMHFPDFRFTMTVKL
jgi:hypothetical protein